jgi:glutamine synthetase
MADSSTSLAEFRERCDAAGVHTVEIGTPDIHGHLRGKRVPVDRFFATTVTGGVHIADAIFVMDIVNDLPENEFINMDSGYLDCHFGVDADTGRILTHRPGYALMFADSFDKNHQPHFLAPRSLLAAQIERCRALGIEPVMATELEFYLCTPDWEPVQSHIQYSSLTDALGTEQVLSDMRIALLGAGIEVESSNAEYGPGQFEINTGHGEAMKVADDTVLFKSIVKQVAVQHGLRATFMPKPWTEASGSGMHVHTSLQVDGVNGFATADGAPNELMASWIAGLLEHAASTVLLGAPNSNGGKRIRPYTFAPTHIHWGSDNRTVLARCVMESGSSANRIEFRSAGADANPYLVLAAILAAGSDGVERELAPPAVSEGDMYTNPGECPPLPADLPSAIAAFEASPLAARLGDEFSRSFTSIAAAEVGLAAENSPDADEVNDWERARFIEHS